MYVADTITCFQAQSISYYCEINRNVMDKIEVCLHISKLLVDIKVLNFYFCFLKQHEEGFHTLHKRPNGPETKGKLLLSRVEPIGSQPQA